MKKFLLMMIAVFMTTAMVAQVPQPLGMRVTSTEAQQKRLPAGMKALNTNSQRMAMLKANDLQMAKAKAAKASKNLTVNNKLGQKATSPRLFNHSLKAQRNAGNVKFSPVKKNTAKTATARTADYGTPVTAPAGLQTETYSLSAFSFYSYSQVSYDVEVGYDGNDAYVKGLLSMMPEGWIKGVKNGNTITFAKDQYLGEAEAHDVYTGESLGMYPVWLGYQDGMTGENVDFVLTINPETGVMDDLAQGALLFNTLNDESLDVLLESRLTPKSAFDNVSYDLVTPPASAESKPAKITAYSLAQQSDYNGDGLVAVDGNDIYVAGLAPDLFAWVKGTLSADGTVTFPKGQYLGSYNQTFDMWFMATDPEGPEGNLKDATAFYDAQTGVLTFGDNSVIIENADPIAMLFADALINVVVTPADDSNLILPPAGLETRLHKAKVISLAQYPYAEGTYNVSIGFDGNDAYMQGLFYYAPLAWMKGVRNADGSITFQKNAYLGKVQGMDIYAVPCHDDESIMDDFTFTYDAANDTYYYNEHDTNLSFSIAPDCTDAVDIIYNVSLAGPDAPVINTDVIIDQPEGDLKVYSRTGGAYYSFLGFIIPTVQNGTMIRIVNDNDGNVYMENPLSQAMVEGGTWVKGYREGNTIHMPLNQCVIYYDDYGYGYMTSLMKLETIYDEDYEEYFKTYVATDDKEMTFTVDDEKGTITMDLLSNVDEDGFADYILGLVYTDDKSWAEFGDFNTTYTEFKESYLTMPEDAVAEDWAMLYFDGDYNNADMVKVAVKDNKMYVAGLSKKDPEATIVGTIADGKVTFASDQYLGTGTGFISYGVFGTCTIDSIYDEYYDTYFESKAFEYAPEFTFAYDTEKKVLTCAKGSFFAVNAGHGADEILYVTVAYDPKFSYFEDKAIKPTNPTVLGFSEWFEDYNYNILSVDIPLEDINGSYIDKDKVYYIIYVKKNGEAQPYVLTSAEYVGFIELGIEEMTEIPYSFTVLDDYGYEDIAEAGSNVILYQEGFDDYGVQTVYYGGGERSVSDIVWLSGEETGIKDATSATATLRGIYDAQGRKLQKLQKGLNIVISGNKAHKVMVK